MKLILPALIEMEVDSEYDIQDKAPLIEECIHRNIANEPAGDGASIVNVRVAIPFRLAEDLSRLKEEIATDGALNQ